MKKIYLSLDDLQKLYGISPAVVQAIKKKRKKRRNKNKKINNGTFGNKPSDSSHMEGYVSQLTVANTQLHQANVNKHIKDINDNNKRIQIDNEAFNDPDNTTQFIDNQSNNLHPDNPDIQFVKYIKDGIASGQLKHNVTKTGFSITDQTLGAKRGRKKLSGKVVEIKSPQKNASRYTSSSSYQSPLNILVKRFERENLKATSTLSNIGSRNIDRSRQIDVMGDFVGDNIGALNIGTSSDGFTVEDAEPELDQNEHTIELNDGAAAAAIQDEEQTASALPGIGLGDLNTKDIGPSPDEIDALFEAEQLKQQQELEAEQEQNRKRKQKPYVPRPIEDYTLEQLKTITQIHNIAVKGRSPKLQTLYQKLLKLN